MNLPDDAFPPVLSSSAGEHNEWVVDAGADGTGVVSVTGRGRFESVRTGKGWDEVFVYRFSGFDVEGRIGLWEIWADPLSAWVACE